MTPFQELPSPKPFSARDCNSSRFSAVIFNPHGLWYHLLLLPISALGRKFLILPLFLEIGLWENTVQCHGGSCSSRKSLIPITSCFLLLFTGCLGRQAGKRVGWIVGDLFSFAYQFNWCRSMAPGITIMSLRKQFKLLLAQMGVQGHVALPTLTEIAR